MFPGRSCAQVELSCFQKLKNKIRENLSNNRGNKMSKSSSKAGAIGGSVVLPTRSPFPGFEEDNELHHKMQGRKVVLMEGMISDLTERVKKIRKKNNMTWKRKTKN